MIVLDTSSIIELLAGTEKGKKIRICLEKEAAATSAITVNELLIGAKNQQIVKDFLKTLHILSFDAEAAFKSVIVEQELKKSGKLIGKLDIFIASICLVHNIAILTTDKDFKNVKALKAVVV